MLVIDAELTIEAFLDFFNTLICILILITGTSGDNILVSGQYGSAEKSPLNEYFILIYFFMITQVLFVIIILDQNFIIVNK